MNPCCATVPANSLRARFPAAWHRLLRDGLPGRGIEDLAGVADWPSPAVSFSRSISTAMRSRAGSKPSSAGGSRARARDGGIAVRCGAAAQRAAPARPGCAEIVPEDRPSMTSSGTMPCCFGAGPTQCFGEPASGADDAMGAGAADADALEAGCCADVASGGRSVGVGAGGGVAQPNAKPRAITDVGRCGAHRTRRARRRRRNHCGRRHWARR